jgi:hypothetical protein
MAVEALSHRPALRIDTSVAKHTAVNGTDTGSDAAPAKPIHHKADSVKLEGGRTDSGIYSSEDTASQDTAGEFKIPRKPVPVHHMTELTSSPTPSELGGSVDDAISSKPPLPPRPGSPHQYENQPPIDEGFDEPPSPRPSRPHQHEYLPPIDEGFDEPNYSSGGRPQLPPRPSRPDLSGAGYDLGGVMESGVTSEVLQVIASKNLSQITMELKTREHLLNAAQEDLARAQSQSRHHPENPKLKASISEAKQNIEQEQANIQELQKAEKAQTPWYQKAMTGLNNPLAQMGAMVGLPMAISLFGGDKSSDAGQNPPSNGDPNSASAGNTDMMHTPLNKTQISYLTAGIPEFGGTSMPGAYPGGGFIGSAPPPTTAGFIG